MKLYYLFLLVMFLLMGCTNSSNISGPNTIGTSSGTCKKCKADLESIIRKVVKEERSQW